MRDRMSSITCALVGVIAGAICVGLVNLASAQATDVVTTFRHAPPHMGEMLGRGLAGNRRAFEVAPCADFS